MWTDKEDVMYIYNGILLSHKSNEIMPFGATGMDLEIITLSQTETNIIGYHLHEESKKWYKWTHLQNRNRLKTTESNLMLQERKKGVIY